MNTYNKLKTMLQNGQGFKEFSSKLRQSDLKNSKEFLGLLLIHLVQLNKMDFYLYLHALLQFGVDPNFTEGRGISETKLVPRSVLMIACQKSNNSTVTSLMQLQDINALEVDFEQENILFYALRNKDEEEAYKISKTLIQYHQQLVNGGSKKRKSLVMLAIERKSLKILHLLLRNNCDPNIQLESSGNTPLHQVLEESDIIYGKQFKEIIITLIQYGANTSLKNNKGEDCYTIAQKYHFNLKELENESQDYVGEEKDLQSQYYSQNTVTKDEDIFSRNTDDLLQKVQYFEMSSDEDEDSDIHIMDFQTLGRQIENFTNQSQKQIQKAWDDINYLYSKLAQLGKKMNLSIDIIGSYATGLWTPESDIDIVYVNSGQNFAIGTILQNIYNYLQEKRKSYDIDKLFLNSDLKFPNISIILKPNLNKRKLDISVFQRRNNGEKYVTFINKELQANPFIKPLFYVFRRILKNFKLNNPSRGGIKTYALFLMFKIAFQAFPSSNIAEALFHFVYYFAHCFPYEEIIQQNGQVVLKLNLIDPINYTNNVGGRHTQTQKVRDMFKSIDYSLRLKTNGTTDKEILPCLFQLHKIFDE